MINNFWLIEKIKLFLREDCLSFRTDLRFGRLLLIVNFLKDLIFGTGT